MKEQRAVPNAQSSTTSVCLYWKRFRDANYNYKHDLIMGNNKYFGGIQSEPI